MPEHYRAASEAEPSDSSGVDQDLAEQQLVNQVQDEQTGNGQDGNGLAVEAPFRRIYPLRGGEELTKAFRPALEREIEKQRRLRERS